MKEMQKSSRYGLPHCYDKGTGRPSGYLIHKEARHSQRGIVSCSRCGYEINEYPKFDKEDKTCDMTA